MYLVQQDRILSGQCHLQRILQVGMYFEFQMIIIVIKTNTIFKDNYKISRLVLSSPAAKDWTERRMQYIVFEIAVHSK